jgi:hypothetical protein
MPNAVKRQGEKSDSKRLKLAISAATGQFGLPMINPKGDKLHERVPI